MAFVVFDKPTGREPVFFMSMTGNASRDNLLRRQHRVQLHLPALLALDHVHIRDIPIRHLANLKSRFGLAKTTRRAPRNHRPVQKRVGFTPG
jgi:predicted PP-loop superfamily ATPase